MGSSSDCSWKKMVIAKNNDKWISTMKSESLESNMNTSNFSLSEEKHYGSIKIEVEDPETDDNDIVPCENDNPELLIIEEDPLSFQPQRQRRRKSSGAKFESPDERSMRLAKMSAYAAQRLANETPEQRAARLKRMSEYAAKRLSSETSEQRAKRLARMSAYAAQRLAKETPEQRQARLARMSAYAARRQATKKMTIAAWENAHDNSNYHRMPNQS